MKSFIYILIIISLLLIPLTSCNLPIDIVQKTPEDADMLAVQTTLEPTNTIAPTIRPTAHCPDETYLGSFFEWFPWNFYIVMPNQKFTWYYEYRDLGPNTSEVLTECFPETYTLYFSTGPAFSDEISVQVTNPATSLYAGPSYLIEWNNDFAFQPMKVYRWIAVGHFNGLNFGTDRIAELHDDIKWEPYNVNRTVNRGIFRTGPVCSSGGVEIPTLLSPANDEVITSIKPEFIWETTNCIPTYHRIQISKLEDIQELSPFFSSTDTADLTLLGGSYYAAYDMASNIYGRPLLDCTKYFWRVRGSIGDPSIGETREYGLWSDTGWFFVNSGTCPTPTPTPTRVPPTKTPTPTATPTPEPVSVDCGNISDATTCNSQSECRWIPIITCLGCGTCVND